MLMNRSKDNSNCSKNSKNRDNKMFSEPHEYVSSTEQSAANALCKLEEIDELLRDENAPEQATLLNYLQTEEHLENVLAERTAELRTYCNELVQLHLSRADDICNLYNSFTECEQQLVEFETGIIQFQWKLEDTANSIAKMQQQTDEVILGVRHRKSVSDKITEVYSALQECDVYCDAIRKNEVDDAYLNNLQELSHKLSFLINNKTLQHSAVDNEIRPKLVAAAMKAGKKLQRFLSQQIMSLAADVVNIAQHQEFLEQRAHVAFRFLQLYNEPVALEISRQYLRTMSEVYQGPFRAITRALYETNVSSVHQIQPLVTVEKMYEIRCNRDTWSPAGNYVNMPPPRLPLYQLSAPIDKTIISEVDSDHIAHVPQVIQSQTSHHEHVYREEPQQIQTHEIHEQSNAALTNASQTSMMPRLIAQQKDITEKETNIKDSNNNNNKIGNSLSSNGNCITNSKSWNFNNHKTASDHILQCAAKHSQYSSHLLRPNIFTDIIYTLTGIVVRFGCLHFDDERASELNKSNSWIWRFTLTLIHIINNTVRECRFIGNFFCQEVNVEGGEDFNKAEVLAKSVLHTSLQLAGGVVKESVNSIRDRNSALAALRVLEVVKQYMCTSLDPIPLLLLSEMVGTEKRMLSNNLYSIMQYDQLTLNELNKLNLQPFRTTPTLPTDHVKTKNLFWEVLLKEKVYLATLTPHEIVCSITSSLAQIEKINILHLQSLTFVQERNKYFDHRVQLFVRNSLSSLLAFIQSLSLRHPVQRIQYIFKVVNLYAVEHIWARTLGCCCCSNNIEKRGEDDEEDDDDEECNNQERNAKRFKCNSSYESTVVSETDTILTSPSSPFSEKDMVAINTATNKRTITHTFTTNAIEQNYLEEEKEQKRHTEMQEELLPQSNLECRMTENAIVAKGKRLSKINESLVTTSNDCTNIVNDKRSSESLLESSPLPPQPLSQYQEEETKKECNNSNTSIITETFYGTLLEWINLELTYNAAVNSVNIIIEQHKILEYCTNNGVALFHGDTKAGSQDNLNYYEKEHWQQQQQKKEESMNEIVETDLLTHDNLRTAAEKFRANWQNDLQEFVSNVHLLLELIFNTDLVPNTAMEQLENLLANKLTKLVIRVYVHQLAYINEKFTSIVRDWCSLHNTEDDKQESTKTLFASLVGNVAIMREAQRLRQLLTPPSSEGE